MFFRISRGGFCGSSLCSSSFTPNTVLITIFILSHRFVPKKWTEVKNPFWNANLQRNKRTFKYINSQTSRILLERQLKEERQEHCTGIWFSFSSKVFHRGEKSGTFWLHELEGEKVNVYKQNAKVTELTVRVRLGFGGFWLLFYGLLFA